MKLPEEITCIRTAAAIAESSLYAAISEVRPGVTEHHLRAAFLDRMCALGTSQFAQQGTFTVIDPGRSVPVDDQRARPARGRLGRARGRRAVGRIRRLTRAHVVVR